MSVHLGSSFLISAYLPLDGFDFRDLVCLECTGSSCPVVRYKSPINDMVVGCQSCYKEWTHGKSTDTRIRLFKRCFFQNLISIRNIEPSFLFILFQMNPMQPENVSSHIIIQKYTGTTVSS